MPTITYTARQITQLKTGHTAGTDYTITVELQSFAETPGSEQVANTTLAGDIYTDLYRTTTQYNITTDFVAETGTDSLEDFREFIYSCLGGYSFTVNVGGTDYPLTFTAAPRITRTGPDLYSVAFGAELG